MFFYLLFIAQPYFLQFYSLKGVPFRSGDNLYKAATITTQILLIEKGSADVYTPKDLSNLPKVRQCLHLFFKFFKKKIITLLRLNLSVDNFVPFRYFLIHFPIQHICRSSTSQRLFTVVLYALFHF